MTDRKSIEGFLVSVLERIAKGEEDDGVGLTEKDFMDMADCALEDYHMMCRNALKSTNGEPNAN